MASASVLEVGHPQLRRLGLWRARAISLKGSEYAWALAFVTPYAAVFLLFVAYPVAYGLWMGRQPALYAQLFADPIYLSTVVNTLLYLAIGVNLKMFCALLLSGFFVKRGWYVKSLLLIFVLPWAVPALPTFISMHWMLDAQWGLLNNLLWTVFHVNGPGWLDSRWLALGSVIASYIWKWMPFWTVILVAGRMAIPRELYEAAAVDGATGLRQFAHISFPLLANLYLICTLLSTIWTLGDFATAYFITNGGPGDTTHVLATLGIRYAFDLSNPGLGVAAMISALPLLIPMVIVLMRKLSTSDVDL